MITKPHLFKYLLQLVLSLNSFLCVLSWPTTRKYNYFSEIDITITSVYDLRSIKLKPYTENDEIKLRCNLLFSQNIIFPIFLFFFFFRLVYACFLCGNSCFKIIKIWTYIFLTFAGKAPFQPSVWPEMVCKRRVIKLLNDFYRILKRFEWMFF